MFPTMCTCLFEAYDSKLPRLPKHAAYLFIPVILLRLSDPPRSPLPGQVPPKFIRNTTWVSQLSVTTTNIRDEESKGLFWLRVLEVQSGTSWPSCFWTCGEVGSMYQAQQQEEEGTRVPSSSLKVSFPRTLIRGSALFCLVGFGLGFSRQGV